MDKLEIERVEKEHIEKLNQILENYCSEGRKSKRILAVIVCICAIALYFVLFDWIGGFLGFVLTIAIVGAGVWCIDSLGVSFKNAPISDGKLSYQACVTMEALIQIKEGFYAKHGVFLIGVGQGKHLTLYKKFIQLYPALESRELKCLSKIEIEKKDIYGN